MNVSSTEILQVAAQFMLLSLLSIGGVSAVLADSQRILVDEHHWLSASAFTESVALAQAAPGPNFLVMAVVGWMGAGPLGLLACLGGILLPSTLLCWRFGHWADLNRQHPALLAFQRGCAPLVLGLTLSGAWVLAKPFGQAGWPAWSWVACVALGAVRLSWPPLVWLGLGAGLGVLELV